MKLYPNKKEYNAMPKEAKRWGRGISLDDREGRAIDKMTDRQFISEQLLFYKLL